MKLSPAVAFLVLLAVATSAQAINEKLVFQGADSPPTFGFELYDHPGTRSCWPPYEAEPCIYIQDNAFYNDYLATKLHNEKHAYRVHFQIYADADGAQSKFRVVLSFVPGNVAKSIEGDGYATGAFGEAVGAVFAENPVGWDIQLIEVNQESYQEIATATEPRDSSAWRAYDFTANSDTGLIELRNDVGDVMASAHMMHHAGKPIESQWYRGTGGNWYSTAHMMLRVGGDSTAVYDQDPRPPVISNLTQTPSLVEPGQSVRVSATIRDDWGQATAVLHSWVNQKPAPDVAMQSSGGTYTATLPGAPADAEVRYQVEATAVSGLKAVSTTIQYVVGSTQPPKDVGGGGALGSITSNEGGLAAVGFVLIAGVGLFAALFEQGVDKKRSATLATLGGVGGLAWVALVYSWATLTAFASGPWFVPGLLIAAILAAAILATRKRMKGVGSP